MTESIPGSNGTGGTTIGPAALAIEPKAWPKPAPAWGAVVSSMERIVAEVDSGRFCQFGRLCLGIFDGQTACGAPQWFGIPEGELEAANLEGLADCLGERPKDPSDVVGATNRDFELVAGDAGRRPLLSLVKEVLNGEICGSHVARIGALVP